MSEIEQEIYEAAKELLELAQAEPGDLLVVGCSTSEVAGARIGEAHLVCARTRAKFIGGERAAYLPGDRR